MAEMTTRNDAAAGSDVLTDSATGPSAAGADSGGGLLQSKTLMVVGWPLLFGAALFPEIVPTSLPDGNSLTLYEAASSISTLQTMSIVALIGMPLVSSYTVAVYWTFRGKVTLDEFSY